MAGAVAMAGAEEIARGLKPLLISQAARTISCAKISRARTTSGHRRRLRQPERDRRAETMATTTARTQADSPSQDGSPSIEEPVRTSHPSEAGRPATFAQHHALPSAAPAGT